MKLLCFVLLLLMHEAALSQSLDLKDHYHSDEPELLVPGVVSTTKGEYSPTLDITRGELYFMRRTPGVFDYTIYVSYWKSGRWSEPTVADFSGVSRDAAPYLSPDGQVLLFDSRRPDDRVAARSINIWKTNRTTDGWGTPELLVGASTNSSKEPEAGLDEFGPFTGPTDEIYFYSFRQPNRGGAFYRSDPPAYNQVAGVRSLPDPSARTFVSYTYLSGDGRTLIQEGRATGRRDSDLFLSCLDENDKWSDPVPIREVNTEYSEGGPYLTADGRLLLFTSDRPSPSTEAASANLYIIRSSKLSLTCNPY